MDANTYEDDKHKICNKISQVSKNFDFVVKKNVLKIKHPSN